MAIRSRCTLYERSRIKIIMNYWLLKSEPDVWSLSQQKKSGLKGVAWDGVRNFQARNNLKKMDVGDLCFFYHSNIGKEIVGVVKVIKKAFLDNGLEAFQSRYILFCILIIRNSHKIRYCRTWVQLISRNIRQSHLMQKNIIICG